MRSYYPAFTPLRAIAIALVFSIHYLPIYRSGPAYRIGWVGVDLFFVLSGFLITGILSDSRAEKHYFRNFYLRRTLRIFPLYYAFFVLLFLLWHPLHIAASGYVFSFALYIGNFLSPYVNLQVHNPTVIGLFHGTQPLRIDHFWSLCVEEQFYLVWPFVVWMAPSRKVLMRICAGGIVTVMALRTGLLLFSSAYFINHAIYTATYTRCDELLVGGWLALWLRETRLTHAIYRRFTHLMIWPSLAVLLIGHHLTSFLGPNYANPFMATVGYDLLAACFAGILMWAIDERSMFARALLFPKTLTSLGTVSYGFYLFHELYEPIFAHTVAPALARHGVSPWIALSAVFCFTWLLSWCSYHLFESRFLALKDRWAPAHQASVAASRQRLTSTGHHPPVSESRVA